LDVKPKSDKVKISISLPEVLVDWIKAEAESEMGDVSSVIRRFLLKAMRGQEGFVQVVNGHRNHVVNGHSVKKRGGSDRHQQHQGGLK